MRRTFALYVALTLLVEVASGQERPSFTVGIVQYNGNIVPIGSFDGELWSNPWPLELDGDPDVGLLDDAFPEWTAGLGVPEHWTLWPESGELSPVVARGLAQSSTHCSENFAITTDIPPHPLECDNCCPIPKLGLAATGDTALVSVQAIEAGSAESVSLLNRMKSTFEELESNAVMASADRYGASDGRLRSYAIFTGAAERAAIPLTLETASKLELGDGISLYYLEIVRSYTSTAVSRPADQPDERPINCPGVSYFRGWFRSTPTGELAPLETDLILLDCDWKGGMFDRVLGYWRNRNGVDVVVRRHGWESEDYVILTVQGNEVNELVRTRVSVRYSR